MSTTVRDILDLELPVYRGSLSSAAGRHRSSKANKSFDLLIDMVFVSAEPNFLKWKRQTALMLSAVRYSPNSFASHLVPESLTSLSMEADVQQAFFSNVCLPVLAVWNHLQPDKSLKANLGSYHAWESAAAQKSLHCYFDIAVRDQSDKIVMVIEMKQEIPDDLDIYFNSMAFAEVSKQLRKYVEASGVKVIMLGDYRQLISLHLHATRTFYTRTYLSDSRWHLFYILDVLRK